MLFFIKNIKLGGYVEFTLEKKGFFGSKLKIERLYLSDNGFINNGKIDKIYSLDNISICYKELVGPYTDEEMIQEKFSIIPLKTFKKQLADRINNIENIKNYTIVNYKPCVFIDSYELVDTKTINIATLQKMCNSDQIKDIINLNNQKTRKEK